jgi:hypothetical protein
MELISPKEVIALGDKRRRLEKRKEEERAKLVQKCYDQCIEHLNVQLAECGKANHHHVTFSFIDLLGDEYHRNCPEIHDRVETTLQARGYRVTHPGWHDHMHEMIHDGVIVIQWS